MAKEKEKIAFTISFNFFFSLGFEIRPQTFR